MKTNVLIILTDDQGWGDLSCHGNTQISTPNIDSMAHTGVSFRNFYVQPLCAPTRAELLTGRRYPFTGVCGVSQGAERIDLEETTIADLFKKHGYRTGCFGKWHSGLQYPYHPNARGFDEFYGFCCGHWSHYFDSTIEHNGEEYKSEGYLADVLTEKAMEFIDQNQEDPFFCYLPLNTPHSPFQVPDKWYSKFDACELPLRGTESEKEALFDTRAALAMCENIDWNVGRINAHLEKLGLNKNTIVVYLSDNGPNGHRWNGGMQGIKTSHREGGVRTPFFMKWDEHLPAGLEVSGVSGAIDLLPTLCDYAGIATETERPLHGKSFRCLLEQPEDAVDWTHEQYALKGFGDSKSYDDRAASLRTDTYRVYEDGSLYDIEKDVGELHDLSAELPDLSAKLSQKLNAWKSSLPAMRPDAVIPVGYREFPRADLQTQDAALSGSLRRSSIHPNCSWVLNWKDVEDVISWEIDVANEGLYEVFAMYNCAEDDVGSQIYFECGGSRCEAEISEAFVGELLDGDDRAVRSESYEKAFKPISLGRIELRRGRRICRLGANYKAGGEVGEFRALRLRGPLEPVALM